MTSSGNRESGRGESRELYCARTTMAGFPVRTAAELMDADFEARWSARETIGGAARATLGAILDRFVTAGGPVPIRTLDVPALDTRAVDVAVAELDRADLVAVRDDAIVLAYPFASAPTGFVTRLADGSERHACCAIDALGIAAMLRAPITVRAACHHCGEPLTIPVEPDGPRDHADLMAWVGRRDTLRAKACEGL
jgi:hypothetical protein